jgi:8-oxo-dGTP pyrophosphatase MutT (NUDIX family)
MTASSSIRQAAVVPVHDGRVCLVLSRSGKRWVVPKGRIEHGQTARETALQEAWEEAGLIGTLLRDPVGSYRYRKSGNTYHVLVFLMSVSEVAQKFPEARWRVRRWFRSTRALVRVETDGLRCLIRTALDSQVAKRHRRAA